MTPYTEKDALRIMQQSGSAMHGLPVPHWLAAALNLAAAEALEEEAQKWQIQISAEIIRAAKHYREAAQNGR